MDRKITLLQADRSLTKKFYTKPDNSYTTDSYPGVSKFSSIELDPVSLEDFYDTLVTAGDSGMCLLKGNLTRPITDESRKGLTQSAAHTHWICLDYDSSEGYATPEDLLHSIDPSLDEVSFIFQHSASAGITKPPGVRGHVFLWLAEALSPLIIKQWLLKLNLNIPELSRQIRLSRNGMALIYPLDTTTCQNDKLIYLAPPSCIGFDDPLLGQRWRLVSRRKACYELQPLISREKNRNSMDMRLRELRDAAGLPQRRAKMEVRDDMEILLNPDECTITVVKDEGEFIRCNLNGGDSGAYWFWKKDPALLHNFKGEPSVYLETIAPDFFRQMVGDIQRNAVLRHFVLRDRAMDTYFTASCDSETLELVDFDAVSSKDKAQDYCSQFGVPRPRIIPVWDVVFDPVASSAVDFKRNRLNTFRPTPYLSVIGESDSENWPIINKIIRHVCVDLETYNHFMNWLAWIYQNRGKSKTAWVFQGAYGTGKGTLFHQIITPIFGANHCMAVEQGNMEEKFNAFLRNNLMVYVDEGNIEASMRGDSLMERLKLLVTEPSVPIRAMRTDTKTVPSYTNIIIATNKLAVKIYEGDRRWNIAPIQTRPNNLFDDYCYIENELVPFCRYLRDYECDPRKVQTPLMNRARQDLIEVSTTCGDRFFLDLRVGDLSSLVEACARIPDVMEVVNHDRFKSIVAEWVRTMGAPIHVPMQDLKFVYEYYTRGEANRVLSDPAFGWLMKKNNMDSKRIQRNGELVRVVELMFHDPNGELEGIKLDMPAKVIPMRGVR